MGKIDRIKRDIKDIKDASGNPEAIIRCFTSGYCYEFAHLLKGMYPSGKIVFDPENHHYMYLIDGKYFDVRGEITLENEERITDANI